MIDVINLSKKNGKKTVLNNINATFEQNQSIAFVGNNGCGKSTFLKIIAGLIRPSSGVVNGNKNLSFHYVPEKFPPLPLYARTYLMRMAEIDGVAKSEIYNTVQKYADDFFMSDLLDVPMNHLSKGSLQKIGVIQALSKRPDILLLDEPLSGQDEESQKVFVGKVNELRNTGIIIFLVAHEKRLVEEISDKVFKIKEGKLIPFSIEASQRVTLIFDNVCSKPIEREMERFGEYYKIQSNQDEANDIILTYLNNGWRLRGMYNE